ncbi:hypothetical protein A0U92_02935 [Acetobacter aceti]|uniref:Exonuclease domain-containing protein n=1 Tax=Acetobacter aceti TaxID=435 RepID=A0A1U9KDP2_ACEAC|nr:3'-5' exonuclease [Acetobacter aceti]AQS83896.1 hypothetical protein A0U92_02935 [Acetobacter aceti]
MDKYKCEILAKIAETTGIGIHELFSPPIPPLHMISRCNHSRSGFFVKDVIFFDNNLFQHEATIILDGLPKRTDGPREEAIRKLVADRYGSVSHKFRLYSAIMNDKNTSPKSLSDGMKKELWSYWQSIRPDCISARYWNNDFIRYLNGLTPEQQSQAIYDQRIATKKLFSLPKRKKPQPSRRSLLLNIESTGISDSDEVIQVTITSKSGHKIYINSLLKPSVPMTEGATDANGITDDMLSGYPTICQIVDELKSITKKCELVAYRIDFDIRLLRQSLVSHGLDTEWLDKLSKSDTKEYWNYAHSAGNSARRIMQELA